MFRQNILFKIIIAVILLGALIFFSNTLIVRSIRAGTVWILKPLLSLARSTGKFLGGSGLSREDTLNLIQENQHLKAAQLESEKLKEDNETLRKTLGFKEREGISLKGADILLYRQESGQESLLINQGKRDGIKEGDIVVDGEEILVGFVQEVGNDFSKVSIASNPGQTMEAELMPLKVHIVAKGLGNRTFSLEFIPQDTPLRAGDFIIFTASGRNNRRLPARTSYPFLLGEVVSKKLVSSQFFQEARAWYLARPQLLDKVFVVLSNPLK